VSQIGIYVDEDAMDSDLVTALRSRGVAVITALDAGLIRKSDEEQLAFATASDCVLYTFNVSDFYRLSRAVGPCRKRARWDDSNAATTVLNWRAVAAHPASSRGQDNRRDAQSGRVPQQLGLMKG
jgi:hypothetical protein